MGDTPSILLLVQQGRHIAIERNRKPRTCRARQGEPARRCSGLQSRFVTPDQCGTNR